MDSLIQPMTMAVPTDRVTLTVRLCADGTREWLDPSGKVALIFFEKGKWWYRQSPSHSRWEADSESDALDGLLYRLGEIKKEAVEMANNIYWLEG